MIENLTCRHVREDAAVALLSHQALPAAVVAHVPSCSACRHEVLDLEETVSMLAATTTPADAVTDAAESPVLDRLLLMMARRRARRRLITTWAAAACLLVAIAAFGAVSQNLVGHRSVASAPNSVAPNSAGSSTPSSTPDTPSADSTSPSQQETVAFGSAANVSTGASATITIQGPPGGAAGSIVSVRLAGVAAGATCRVVVLDRNGRRESAGVWRVDGGYSRDSFPERVAMTPSDIASVEIMNVAKGEVMVTVPVHQL